MKTLHLTLPLVALTGLMLGCPGADDAPIDTETTSGEPTTTGNPTTTPMTMTTMVDIDTTAGTAEGTTTTPATEGSSTTEPEPGPFVFDETPYEDYVRVDRKGFPAVNTALNLLGDKMAYNQGNPVDDAAMMFSTSFEESLETLHLGQPGMQAMDNTGLDDDLIGLGFVPCVPPPLLMDSCDDQAGPLAIPDVLGLDLDDPPLFPNGRQLPEPVMDQILAVVLLDFDVEGLYEFVDFDHDGVPGPSVNPVQNDLEFDPGFPYLAAAHE